MQLIEILIGTAAFIAVVSKPGQPIMSCDIKYHIRIKDLFEVLQHNKIDFFKVIYS